MPRKSGQRKSKGSRDRLTVAGYFNEADIKLGDFADNPAARLPARTSKKNLRVKYDKAQLSKMGKENQPTVPSKLTTVADAESPTTNEKNQQESEDLAWDERDWDDDNLGDFNLTSYLNGSASSFVEEEVVEEEDEEEDVAEQKSKRERRKRRRRKSAKETDGGKVYLPDIWYLLADFIRPEDVGTFSCLCRDAYRVTKTAAFWRKLYERCFNPEAHVPSNLQPPNTKRNLGLRATVIRALYVIHPPYKKIVSAPSPVGEGQCSPDTIINYACLYTWSRGKHGSHYTHYIKLRQPRRDGLITLGGGHVDEGIHANENSGERVLRVHCEHFQDVPSARIMGLEVVRASVSVSANMRHHKLKLVFGRIDRRGASVQSSLVAVTLDPVLRVDVLPWWHPHFRESSQPCSDRAVAENATNSRENNAWEGI